MLINKETAGLVAGLLTGMSIGLAVDTGRANFDPQEMDNRAALILTAETALGLLISEPIIGRQRLKLTQLLPGSEDFSRQTRGPKISASGISTRY